MKKIVIALSLLAFPFVSISQEYTPMLDIYNEWNVRFCYQSLCDTDLYYTNGDTIVDGMNYKVLDGYHYISRGFLLREDIEAKKVYLKAILPNGTFDYLLYDFSMEVGDSIDMKNPITPFPENAGYYKVDSIIPHPLVDGNNYNHFYLSPTPSNTVGKNNAEWIEGAGSLSIITAPGGDPDVDGVGRLACMFKNGESFYSDLTIIEECEPFFILNNPTVPLIDNDIKVINLPNKNEFEILNANDLTEIQLYNISGQLLNVFDNKGQQSLRLNLSQYSSGIYLLIAKSNEVLSRNLKIILK